LFNASKAYVQQLKKGQTYNSLTPVYGLSLVNENFELSPEFEKTYYHHYQMVHTQNPEKQIEGLELIFIELPKFTTQNFTERKLQYLWLKFMTDIDETTREIPRDLAENQSISEAISLLQASGFNQNELAYYDKYWDSIRIERSSLDEKFEEGRAEGEQITKEKIARDLIVAGVSVDIVAKTTGLTLEQIEKLK
jgi:predicted transposase/invertase (TIGR01784 family)